MATTDNRRRIAPHGEQRYRLTSKNPMTGKTMKFTCPQCGRKERFCRYWDHSIGDWCRDTLAGKCDRVNNCGYEKFPDKDASCRAVIIRHEISTPKHAETPLIPMNAQWNEWKSIGARNCLTEWFRSMFGKEVADQVWDEYGATAVDNSRVAFWQFSGDGTAVTARVIPYKPDGHRDKGKAMYWAHNTLKTKGYNPAKHLFGLRHAMGCKAARIAVVESEKSALLCECARRRYGIFNDYVFVATGGATFLQTTLDGDRELLGDRDVYLFPDRDSAGCQWRENAAKHNAGVEDSARIYAEEIGADGSGYDIGDLVCDFVKERQREERKTTERTLEDVVVSFGFPAGYRPGHWLF